MVIMCNFMPIQGNSAVSSGNQPCGFAPRPLSSSPLNLHWEQRINIFARITPPLQLNFDALKLHYYTQTFWLAAAGVIVAVLMLHGSYLVVGDADTPTLRGALWMCARAWLWLMTSVLFIPTTRTLLSAYHCVDTGLGLYMQTAPTNACWTSAHVPYVTVAAVCLVLFMIVSARLLRVLSSLPRVAVFFWANWKFDKPDIGRVHFASQRNTLFILVQSFIAVFFVTLSLFGQASSPMGVASSFLFASLLIVACGLFSPPYWSATMNSIRVGLFASVAWTNVCAMITAQLNTAANQHAWISIVYFAGMVSSFVIVALLTRWRCISIEQAEQRARLFKGEQLLHASITMESGANLGANTGIDDVTLSRARAKQEKYRCEICSTTMPAFWRANHLKSLKHVENLKKSTISSPFTTVIV